MFWRNGSSRPTAASRPKSIVLDIHGPDRCCSSIVETLTGAHDSQGLRFGCFQERGLRYDWRVAAAATKTLTREKLDTLWNEGIFYEPKNCTPEEIVVMEDYAAGHRIDLITRDEFVRKILHRNHYVKYGSNWKERLRNRASLSDIISHSILVHLQFTAGSPETIYTADCH
jgi:hypothetical protein